MNTMWGKSQQKDKVMSGVTFHSTAGHGGYMVSPTRMTPFLFEVGVPYGTYYCFEEDCLFAAVEFVYATEVYEHFASLKARFVSVEDFKKELLKILWRWEGTAMKKWFPATLPGNEEEYKNFLARRS